MSRLAFRMAAVSLILGGAFLLALCLQSASDQSAIARVSLQFLHSQVRQAKESGTIYQKFPTPRLIAILREQNQALVQAEIRSGSERIDVELVITREADRHWRVLGIRSLAAENAGDAPAPDDRESHTDRVLEEALRTAFDTFDGVTIQRF